MAIAQSAIEKRTSVASVSLDVHPIFAGASPVSVAPVGSDVGFGGPASSPNPGAGLVPGPIHASTGQNVANGSAPTQAFANGTAPVLFSTSLGYASVGTPAIPAISSSSTVSASPSFESETNLETSAGAPSTASNAPTASSIESAVAYDLPGGTLLSSLPSWFWILAGALVLYLWYTGESPRQVVKQVTA
jgi:hypothetical protein